MAYHRNVTYWDSRHPNGCHHETGKLTKGVGKMKKKEFIEILDEVKKRQHEALNLATREKLGLVDESKTIPFEKIEIALINYSSENEADRIEEIKGLNKNIREQRDNDSSSPPPSLIPEYPVFFLLKYMLFQDNDFILDNKTMFDLCVQSQGNTITERWNKTVYEYFKNKQHEKFRKNENDYLLWFEDKDITISDVEPLVDEWQKAKDKKEHTYKDHPYFKNLGHVAESIVKILEKQNKIKHRALQDELKNLYPKLDVEYTQSLAQAFRGNANTFYKDEIGHNRGYWFLKNK